MHGKKIPIKCLRSLDFLPGKASVVALCNMGINCIFFLINLVHFFFDQLGSFAPAQEQLYH